MKSELDRVRIKIGDQSDFGLIFRFSVTTKSTEGTKILRRFSHFPLRVLSALRGYRTHYAEPIVKLLKD